MAIGFSTVLTVGMDQTQARLVRELLDPDKAQRVIYVGVKNATRGAKTDVVKVVKDETTLKPKYIGRVIKTVPPAGNPPVGQVQIKHQLLPIVAYQISGTGKGGGGVTATVSNSRGPIIFKRAFVAKVRSEAQRAQGVSHRGVFLRSKHLPTKGANMGKGRIAQSGYAGRLAIGEAFGPAVVDLVSQDKLGGVVLEGIQSRLHDAIDSQIDRWLGGKAAREEATLALAD